jgi:hypothetical protein
VWFSWRDLWRLGWELRLQRKAQRRGGAAAGDGEAVGWRISVKSGSDGVPLRWRRDGRPPVYVNGERRKARRRGGAAGHADAAVGRRIRAPHHPALSPHCCWFRVKVAFARIE